AAVIVVAALSRNRQAVARKHERDVVERGRSGCSRLGGGGGDREVAGPELQPDSRSTRLDPELVPGTDRQAGHQLEGLRPLVRPTRLQAGRSELLLHIVSGAVQFGRAV